MKREAVASNVQEVRRYIVGTLVELEDKLSHSQKDREDFLRRLDDAEELMIKLRLRVDEEFDNEVQELKAAINVQQTMLTYMDSETQKAIDEGRVRRESLIADIRPLNAGLEMLAKDIKVRFQKSKPTTPKQEAAVTQEPIIKKTIVEIKQPEHLEYTPEELYIKRNMVNNQYLAARMIDYFRRIGVLHIKEIVHWMEKEFPGLQTRWSSMEKGVYNVMRLIKEQNLEQVGNGIYKLKKDENIG